MTHPCLLSRLIGKRCDLETSTEIFEDGAEQQVGLVESL